ncbi:hypothetical protein [Saccharothrix sp. HUAS TT1]|uniref:phage tail tube protein n=1 Tax=unclassified Saccharothrix TaxID=2593673 RepID=UPI00345C0D65
MAAFDPDTGFATYETLGHTARDELPVFGFDGGETELRGSWQNASLREVTTEVASDYVTFNAHQFDEQALGLYYSVTNPGSTPGVFEVQEAPSTPIQKAILIVVVDGDVNIGFHATKASIRREDAIELAVDEFAFMPLRATFLKDPGSPLFSWISSDTGVNVS